MRQRLINQKEIAPASSHAGTIPFFVLTNTLKSTTIAKLLQISYYFVKVQQGKM